MGVVERGPCEKCHQTGPLSAAGLCAACRAVLLVEAEETRVTVPEAVITIMDALTAEERLHILRHYNP